MRQTLVKKHLLRIAALACITGFLSLSGTMAFAADSTPAGHTLTDRHVARGMKCTACHVDAKGGARILGRRRIPTTASVLPATGTTTP